MKKIILAIVVSCLALSASAADRDAIKFDQYVTGPTLTEADLAGKVLVVHQWQAH